MNEKKPESNSEIDDPNNKQAEVPKYICQGFNNMKQEYKKDEMNKMFKDLFESFNINFLIGSGYSYEKLKTLGNLEDLIYQNTCKNKGKIDRQEAIENLILYDFFNKSIYPHVQDIVENLSFDNSNNFVLHLDRMLSNRNDKNLLNRINIFTTNYDMFFELSLEGSGIYYNDGFSGRLKPKFSTKNYNKIIKQIVQITERESQIPTINLFKIHGSLSWNKNDNDIYYRNNLVEIINKIEESGEIYNEKNFFYKKNIEKNSSNIEDAINQINNKNYKFDGKIMEKVKLFHSKYKELYIVNPTKKKFEETLLSNAYYDLLRMYSNELEKNHSILLVFGFSFRDEHLYSITKRALSNPSMLMYIFVFSNKDVKEFEKKFKDYNNVFLIYLNEGNLDIKEFNSLVFGG